MLLESSPADNQLPDSQQPDGLLAPLWHTAVVVFVIVAASLAGARSAHTATQHGKIAQYVSTMTLELLLTGFVYLGTRKRITLRDLIGARWALDEFLKDSGIAALFWILSMTALGIGAQLLHLDEGGKIDSMRRQLGFLVPGTTLELMVWCCLSVTAGICEEILFRGYLQRQLALVSRSMLAGVLLSAVVFGAAHGYEGVPRMLLVGLFGLLLGLLAWWRKSLRPGMIAHAWHDALSGAVLRLLR